MRRLARVWLVLGTMLPLLPGQVLAQGTQPAGTTVSGRVVDGAGQLVTHERVELLFDGTVIDTTATGRQGEWTFQNVRAGDYFVRTRDDCQVFGTRTVVAGQPVDDVEIVMTTPASRSAGEAPGAAATLRHADPP